MIDFQPPALTHRARVEALLADAGPRPCEYTFTNLYVWSAVFRQELALENGCLLVRLQGRDGLSYLWPTGPGELHAALSALRQDAASQGQPLRLVCLSAAQVRQLDEDFPGAFTVTTDRDGCDYLYEVARLAELSGKRLHAKRNFCNRFLESCPNWTWEDLSPENAAQCLAMDEIWSRQAHLREDGGAGQATLDGERDALGRALGAIGPLGLVGGLIRVDGAVAAFTAGSFLTDEIFDVHFEKAYAAIPGAYPMINRELARRIRACYPKVRYLNREDDMGLEGLRKSKESYYPDLLFEKFSAVLGTGKEALL